MEERNEISILNSLAMLNELTTVGRALQLAEPSSKKILVTVNQNRPKKIKLTLYCAWAMNKL